MTYGLQVYASDGVTLRLDISDKTPRLFSVSDVVVPASGTTTVTVSSAATPTNSVAVLDNGVEAVTTATGQVTIYGSSTQSGATKLRMLLLE